MFANKAAWRNLDTFHGQKISFSSTKRYFQGNSEARRTEIIQKWWIGFQDNKNLSSLRHTWVACEQALLFGRAKRASRERSLAHSCETRFARPNRRACSQAISGNWLGLLKEISVRHHQTEVDIYSLKARFLYVL